MQDMRQMTGLGRSIEDSSFAIVDREAGEHAHAPAAWAVVRRVIHATADFEFKTLMHFHPAATSTGVEALRRGANIIVDVRMIAAGLSEERLAAYGCKVLSYISDPEVITTAKANNSTRAIEAMRKAQARGELEGAIIAIGNAPTALLELVRMIQDEGVRPALIVGVPVGFVSAAESKEACLTLHQVPHIVARGRKGGSPIAVAILHALLLLSAQSKQAEDAAAKDAAS